MKPWRKFPIKLALPVVVAVLFFYFYHQWNHGDDETWHCYDSSGKPAGNVLIVCWYALPSYNKSGVNFRFSDASGKIVLDLDSDTPRGLNRSHACIYSSDLKNGDVQIGERWHEGEPIPTGPAFFDEWNNNIFIRPAAENDASARHAAVEALISTYVALRREPNGGAKLEKELRSFVARERDEFLAKYGEEPVPPAFFQSPTFRMFHDKLPKIPKDQLKFKDITLEIP